jgi:hypothetical protein
MFSIRRIFNRYLSNITKNTLDWATSDTNGLVKQLSARIKAGGPITVADFMRESLLNPNYVCVICSRILSFLLIFFNLHLKLDKKKILVTIIILLGLLHTA